MEERDEMLEKLDRIIKTAEEMRQAVLENGDTTIGIFVTSALTDGDDMHVIKNVVGPEYLIGGLLLEYFQSAEPDEKLEFYRILTNAILDND